MMGKIEAKGEEGASEHHRCKDLNLGKLQEKVRDRETRACRSLWESQKNRHGWVTEQQPVV